jgi:hypothetical protein
MEKFEYYPLPDLYGERAAAQLQELLQVMHGQACDPNRPDTDEFISPFYQATIESINEEARKGTKHGTLDLLSWALASRIEAGNEMDMQTFSKLWFRVVHKQVIRKVREGDRDEFIFPDYPGDEYKTVAHWRMVLDEIVQNPTECIDHDEVYLDITRGTVQSNVPPRAVGPALLMLSEKDRLGERPSVLEAGCSDVLLLKKLATGGKFRPIEVMNGPYGRKRGGLNPTFTHYVNQLLENEVAIDMGVGIDVIDVVGDKYNRLAEWIRACSIRPKEMLNPYIVSEWDRLHEASLDDCNITFVQGDFTRKGQPELEKKLPQNKFSLVMVPTMMYLLSRKERLEVQDMAREYVTDDGFVMYQDFAKPNPRNPKAMSFFKDWKRWTYRTIIDDPHENFKRLYEVFIWGGGRCRDLMPGESIGKLVLGRELERLAHE